jgi:hypothetical protein
LSSAAKGSNSDLDEFIAMTIEQRELAMQQQKADSKQSAQTKAKVVGGVIVEKDGQPVALSDEDIAKVQRMNKMLVANGNEPYDLSANVQASSEITGTGQTAANMGNTMNVEQQSLNNSQSQQNGGGAPMVATSVNAPVTNSTSTVNNFTAAKQPSAVDYTDYNMAFNSTGNSR